MVLTPTRELAVQISEQFGALGALMGLRHTVVIGGVGLLEQSLELSGWRFFYFFFIAQQ